MKMRRRRRGEEVCVVVVSSSRVTVTTKMKRFSTISMSYVSRLRQHMCEWQRRDFRHRLKYSTIDDRRTVSYAITYIEILAVFVVLNRNVFSKRKKKMWNFETVAWNTQRRCTRVCSVDIPYVSVWVWVWVCAHNLHIWSSFNRDA